MFHRHTDFFLRIFTLRGAICKLQSEFEDTDTTGAEYEQSEQEGLSLCCPLQAFQDC